MQVDGGDLNPHKCGERILSEKPFVYILQSKNRMERCDYCLTKCEGVKCPHCLYVYFCTPNCFNEAVNVHKEECKYLRRVGDRTIPDAARLLLRIMFKLKEERPDLPVARGVRRFQDLESHFKAMREDENRYKHVAAIYGVLNSLGVPDLPTVKELMIMYGRLIINSFNILDPEMSPIGTAIYLKASVINHDCTPNAVATFIGTTLNIHIIKDMPQIDLSKIFISYIDVLNNVEQRRKELQDNYYFTCICRKCVDPKEQKEMEAAACPNKSCTEFVDITLDNCGKCGTPIDADYRADFYDTLEVTKFQLSKMKNTVYFDTCCICVDKQKEVMHPLNVWHIKTLDAALESAIQLERWHDALYFSKSLIPGYRKYLETFNPLLGLLLAKSAKLQLLKNLIKQATESTTEAIDILERTHGRDNPIFEEHLIPLMIQVNYENALK